MYLHTHYVTLEECRILWGEPERMHVQNMEQLHAQDCHWDVTEHSTTSSLQKNTCTTHTLVDQAMHGHQTVATMQELS